MREISRDHKGAPQLVEIADLADQKLSVKDQKLTM